MLENGADVDGEYRAMLPLELCIRNRMWDHASLLLANDATVYRYFYELAEKRNSTNDSATERQRLLNGINLRSNFTKQ